MRTITIVLAAASLFSPLASARASAGDHGGHGGGHHGGGHHGGHGNHGSQPNKLTDKED